ncbi:hypothetical protein OHA25_47985 [Nonomuraea sp. NBC_00507]|uniref:hypothetical protein n=1 Tax=Nonomuraea sp. NBC_00507 TaxID=2976002 RepID=UPI002E18A556
MKDARIRIAIAALALALVIAAVITVVNSSKTDEVLGVSYGDTIFDDGHAEEDPAKKATQNRINSIFEKIHQENTRVEGQAQHYVRIALLMPLTISRSKQSAIPLSQIEHALQGAYTALKRVNSTGTYGSFQRFQVQLVLVNQGSRQNVDDWLIDEMLDESEPDHPLEAVIGLGSSVVNTETVVAKLGDKGLAMVSAITSADSLTGMKNFWSVSPSNIQYVQALASFVRGQNLKAALPIADANDDPFTSSLAAAFREQLRGVIYVSPAEQKFNGGTIDQPATPGVFDQVINNVCGAVNDRTHPVDTLLYAGRVADFPAFITDLSKRTCVGTKLTVLTAATGFASASGLAPLMSKGNIEVYYASSSAAPGWEGKTPPPDYHDFLNDYRREGFTNDQDLGDGLAIAHHDALVTAVYAARNAVSKPVPKPQDLPTQLNNITFTPVRGASGPIKFEQGSGGRRVGMDIPIRRLY